MGDRILTWKLFKFYIDKLKLLLLDADECSQGTHRCSANALCTNTIGSHRCTCKSGYKGIGMSCEGKKFVQLIT